jgi:diguanylate cyclase (GGDEF)-like protein
MSTSSSAPYSPERASRVYNIAVLALFALVIGVAGLTFTLQGKQQQLARVAGAVQQQYALTQRIAMLILHYEAMHDTASLDQMKTAASAALANHDALAPLISAVPPVALADGTQVAGIDVAAGMHAFIDKAYAYAIAPIGTGAHEAAQAMALQARGEISEKWIAAGGAAVANLRQQAEQTGMIVLALCALTLAALCWDVFGIVRPAMRFMFAQKKQLESTMATDMMTGVYNRAMLFRVAAMLISSCKRHKQDLTIVAVDIDDLKKINDEHGRAAGDGAIKVVAKILASLVRTSDALGRVGAGEFAVFLPSTDEQRAELVAQKLRTAVEEAPFTFKENTILLRVSIGVALMAEHHKTPDDLLRAAETVLGHAKDMGRNRVSTQTAMMKAATGQAPAAAG